jgi:hypothetical protein
MKSPELSLFLFAYKIDKKLAIAKRTKKVNFLVRALHYLEVYFFSFACIIGNFKLRMFFSSLVEDRDCGEDDHAG